MDYVKLRKEMTDKQILKIENIILTIEEEQLLTIIKGLSVRIDELEKAILVNGNTID